MMQDRADPSMANTDWQISFHPERDDRSSRSA